jgi:hypothetical protein
LKHAFDKPPCVGATAQTFENGNSSQNGDPKSELKMATLFRGNDVEEQLGLAGSVLVMASGWALT